VFAALDLGCAAATGDSPSVKTRSDGICRTDLARSLRRTPKFSSHLPENLRVSATKEKAACGAPAGGLFFNRLVEVF